MGIPFNVRNFSFALKSLGTNAKTNERNIRYEHVVEGSTQIVRDHEGNRKPVLAMEHKAGMQG